MSGVGMRVCVRVPVFAHAGVCVCGVCKINTVS